MEYIWQISFPLFSFLFEMNCRLAASNVWHSFSFSLLGLNPNTNLNFTSSALFVNILAVAAKCFPKAHKPQNPKGKYCLAAMNFAFYPLSQHPVCRAVGRSEPTLPSGSLHALNGDWRAGRSRRWDASPTQPGWRDASPTQPGWRDLPHRQYELVPQPCSPGATSSPRAAWAANKTMISSWIPLTCWIKQAVKYHYTHATDSKDQFRLPQWVVAGTNAF